MATLKGILGVSVGLAVAVGSLFEVVLHSPFMTAEPNIQMVYMWAVGFLLGIFIFGWGLAKFVGY